MATSINSTALDFNNIKNNLKRYLQSRDEFKDYNFEASGLSNILDVLAYNTHINALVSNFIVNESYLNTAQLRSSVVSLAETLGYIPSSNTSAIATVKITVNDNSAPINLVIPAYTQFTGEINNTTYTFLTVENHTAVKTGTGLYSFTTSGGSADINIYQGEYKTATFTAIPQTSTPIYKIKNDKLDTQTVTVKVYPPGSSSFVEYKNITTLATVDDNSTFYILRESPTGGFDLTFGDTNGFGIHPEAGYKIVVEFVEGIGDGSAAGIGQFTPAGDLEWTTYTNGVPSVGTSTMTVVTVAPSFGGNGKESTSSIKLKAPFNYAAQNRAITAQDYVALINRGFGTYLQDVVAWGGQDNVDPEFGAVFVSLNFFDSVTSKTRTEIKNNILSIQANQGILAYKLRFADPDISYLSVNIESYYNPSYTSTQTAGIETAISNAVSKYFTENINTNRFQQSVQTSKLLSYIDVADPGIVGSTVDLLLQKRFVPFAPTLRSTLNNLADVTPLTVVELDRLITLANLNKYEDVSNFMLTKSSSNYLTIYNTIKGVQDNLSQQLSFPVELADPTKVDDVIYSTSFIYETKTAVIKNIPGTYQLGIYDVVSNTLIINIGSYDTNGRVTLNYFVPTDIINGTLKILGKPKNKAIVYLNKNELIQYDNDASTITLVQTSLRG